jgi:hypothetical protein
MIETVEKMTGEGYIFRNKIKVLLVKPEEILSSARTVVVIVARI